jgi:Dyp-type peroxidase family
MLELATNSTFMVYRKLRQNVSGFWEDLKERAKHLDDKTSADKITAVKLAEHMVGRRRDGTPLGYTNGNSGGAGVPVPRREHNTFDYSDDPHGARCPLGAHIRRANPRASLGFGTVLVDRHRILRRGIPYGPYSPKPEEADEKHERGLVFIALNASIARQFEFVQKRWMNDGNNFNMGNDRDPIAGNHAADSRFVMNAAKGGKQAVTICSGLRNYVTTRGGDYFFLPGLGGLRYLAEGSYHL